MPRVHKQNPCLTPLSLISLRTSERREEWRFRARREEEEEGEGEGERGRRRHRDPQQPHRDSPRPTTATHSHLRPLSTLSRHFRPTQGLVAWLTMHPPLTIHRHPMCVEIIEQFQKCHVDHPVAKFFGECTDLKIKLDRCFRQEKALKRKANFEESKKLKERLQAYRKENDERETDLTQSL